MRCPACQQPTTETAEQCACGFSLAALDRVLGMPPVLQPGVNDVFGDLTGREIRQIRHEIARLERRFPQLGFSVVVAATPQKLTLPLYAFWLFNRTGIASAVERGGVNRHVLLVMDPGAGNAVCMIGYGLEPFLPEASITSALNAAFAALAADEAGRGILAFLDEMEVQLATCLEHLDKTFGIGENEFLGLTEFEQSEQENAVAY